MPPTYVIGNLWDEIGKADIVFVTANSMVTHAGTLVMGRGAAWEASQRYPAFPHLAGDMILARGMLYGIACWRTLEDRGTEIGLFQVKFHWRDPARLDLIAYSAGMLAGMAYDYQRLALNFPGIGNGRLARELVEPWLATLPPHVSIYSKEDQACLFPIPLS